MVSLLKAWWGDAATRDNDWCFDYLPRISGDHSYYQSCMDMLDGRCKGFFVMGQNPAVGAANGKLQRLAMANLDWMVVRDLVEVETASFWHDSPEIESGELRTEDIGTEVFLMPAATHVEKEGSFTNTQRLLQWRNKAVEPEGDCRSELWFMYHLGNRLREKLAGSDDPRDRPLLDLAWDYDTRGPLADPDAEQVLREISGYSIAGDEALDGYLDLRDDGSTACGCWIYSGVYAGEVNQANRRKPGGEQSWVAPEWGWAWPLNRRIIYNRASADPDGNPWSERKRYVWWDAAQGKWTGEDVPDITADLAPDHEPEPGATAQAALERPGPVRDAGRRQGVAVRAKRLGGRSAADPLRARGVAVRQRPPPRAPVQSRPPALRPAGEPVQPIGRRPPRRRVPIRALHLPADRAPHGRRHDALAAAHGGADARDVLRGLARSWPSYAGWSTVAGPLWRPCARRSRRACW